MIRMHDFRAEPESLLRAELAAAEQVLCSGWFVLGSEVRSFEEEWAAYCGARFAVGTGNGMDAIEISLRALGLQPGDEVIAPAMTAAASVLGIVRAGATPVLADVLPGTALLDRASVERCLTPRTRAVLLVHLYGRLSELEAWTSFCRERKLHLVEDAAQAHGAAENGRRAGTFGICGAFSFYPTKNLGARGDGGALVTSDSGIAQTAARLRHYGQGKQYEHSLAGLNSRLDELQATILRQRLHWLDAFNGRRREVADAYRACVRNARIELPPPPGAPESDVHHLFVIRCKDRERLVRFLEQRGIQTQVHYPVPIHQQPWARQIRRDPAGLQIAERHAAECLSIPCHPQLDNADVEKVIGCLNEFA